MTLDPYFTETSPAHARDTEQRLEQSEHAQGQDSTVLSLAMSSNDVSIISAADEHPMSGYSHHGYVAANEAVDAALTLPPQSAARRSNPSEIDVNAAGGFCEACHRSALPTHSVLERLRPESSCRSTLNPASEGSDTEDPLYRLPPPHPEKVALSLGYTFLLTARNGHPPSRPCSPDSWDPYLADDELSDSLSTMTGYSCSGASYETDITDGSDLSLMTLDELDYLSEYSFTSEGEDENVTAAEEWHSTMWHAGPQLLQNHW